MPMVILMQYSFLEIEIIFYYEYTGYQLITRNNRIFSQKNTSYPIFILRIFRKILALKRQMTVNIFFRKCLKVSRNNFYAGMHISHCQKRRYTIPDNNVITIQKIYISAAGGAYACVACGRETAIYLAGDYAEFYRAIVLGNGSLYNRHAVVATTIIYNYAFHSAIGSLCHDRLEAFSNIILNVIDRDDY